MATGPTPPTIPPAEPGMPPSEWLEDVLASSPAKGTPATLSETPGRESGADTMKEKVQRQAPKGLEEQQAQPSGESKQTIARDQPSISETAAQTVKQYVPRKTVEYVTQTAAAAAAAAIPQGIKNTVTSYLSSEEKNKEPHVSLPSTELKGAQPSEHTGGVGALPGNLSESSVALLPDERQERAQERRPTSPRLRRDTIKPFTAGGDDETQLREYQRVEETKTSWDATLSKDEAVVPQQSIAPATDTETAAAETVESNIAARSGPEVGSQKASEIKSEEALGKQEKAEAVVAASTVGTAPDTGELSEKGSNLVSETPGEGKGPSQDVQGGGNEGRTAPTEKVEEGYGEEYHPAQLHPPPPGASVAEYQASVGTQQQGQDLPTTRTGKRGSVSGERKPGLMTVVKGEMKILAGKMSRDEHKVEEGRKIVHGQV